MSTINQNSKTLEANKSGRRYVIHQGGTGSGKTFSVLQYLLQYAKDNPGSLISIVSESLPHLKRGAIRDTKRILMLMFPGIPVIENKTEHTFMIGEGGTIEFFAADIASKLRGARRDILFINECNNVDFESFQQLDVRTRKQTILDFNPVRRFWVHDDLLPSLQKGEYLFVKSTYTDNPGLTQAEIDNIERRRGNANWWKVYGEGEIGQQEGVIFSNWEIIAPQCPPEGGSSEAPLSEGLGRLLGYGIDFGFTHSPTAIVQVNEFNGELYVKELFYRNNTHNDKLFDFVSAHINLNALAVADSAEPRTIQYLFQKGWKGIKPASKGPDSVGYGISLLQDRKINVTADSLNLIKELREYSWNTDLDGKTMDVPIKDNDHAIDALRYIYSYPKKRRIIIR